jgi:hypothetical protein
MKDLQFFYCYDKNVMKWLRYEKTIPFVCTGKNVNNDKQFWQFIKTPELLQALEEVKTAQI